MFRRKHTPRAAAPVTAVAALTLFAGSVQAADSRPVGMTKAEYRALVIHNEALNTLHGNAATRLSPRVFGGLYQAGAHRMAPQELAAHVVRGEALNRS